MDKRITRVSAVKTITTNATSTLFVFPLYTFLLFFYILITIHSQLRFVRFICYFVDLVIRLGRRECLSCFCYTYLPSRKSVKKVKKDGHYKWHHQFAHSHCLSQLAFFGWRTVFFLSFARRELCFPRYVHNGILSWVSQVRMRIVCVRTLTHTCISPLILTLQLHWACEKVDIRAPLNHTNITDVKLVCVVGSSGGDV